MQSMSNFPSCKDAKASDNQAKMMMKQSYKETGRKKNAVLQGCH